MQWRCPPEKLALGLVGLLAFGCGDDSKPIPQQWPNQSSGTPGTTATTPGPSGTAAPGGNTSAAPSSTTTAPTETNGSGTTSAPTTQSTSSGTGGGSTQNPDPTICAPDTYRCVAAIPADWEGPVARKGKTAQGFIHSCEGEYRFTVNETPYHAGPQFSPATCTECWCGAPTGGSCSQATNVEFFKETGCQPADLLTSVATVLADGTCSAVVGASGLAKSVKVPAITLDSSNVACAANGGFESKGAYSWSQQERLCRGRGSDTLKCPNATDLCVPKVPSSFTQGVCIFRAGDHSCPAQGYTNKVLLYRGVEDTRGCSDCACGPVTGDLSCQGFLRQFPNSNCTESTPTVSESLRLEWGQPSTCGEVSNFIPPAGVPQGVALEVEVSGLSSAQCTASGGAATGQVQGADPVTICCTDS